MREEGPKVSLHLGDCLEVLKTLEPGSIDAVVTDPPYGENMGIEGDGGLACASRLLEEMLGHAERLLVRGGHCIVFWTMRNLDVCIEKIKGSRLTYRRVIPLYIARGSSRPYLGWLPRVQAIVVAQKYLPKQPSDFHLEMADYINQAIVASGMSRCELARELGCDSRLIMKWSRVGDPAWCLPTARFYWKLKAAIKLDDRYDFLAEPRGTRRDYEYKHDLYVFDEPMSRGKSHPCQKPLDCLEHIVHTVASDGDTVIDPFMGSGTTGVACIRTGRNFIGIEIDSKYHAIARDRIEAEQAKMSLFESAHQELAPLKTGTLF